MTFDGQSQNPWGEEDRINKMVFIGLPLPRLQGYLAHKKQPPPPDSP